MDRSTVTRHLDRLERERLVIADEQRGTRQLALPSETRVLLQAAAYLAAAIAKAQFEADAACAKELRKEGFATTSGDEVVDA